jgi:PAS domain S-box-containing protein
MELQTEFSQFSEWYNRNAMMKFVFEESSSLLLCVNSIAREIFMVSKQLIQVLEYGTDFQVNDLNVIMDREELKKYFDSIDNSTDIQNSIQIYLKTKNNNSIPVTLKAKKIDDTGISFWLLEIKSKYNEEYFKVLFDNYSDIVFIHDMYGKILYANTTATDYLGCSLEEIKDKKLSSFGISIDFTVLGDKDDEIFKLSLVSVLKNKDGEMHDVKIDSKLINIVSEQFVISVIRETTLFKQRYIEKRLLESSLGQILNFMNVGIIIFNEEGYVTHISSNCETITGITGDSWNENSQFLVDKIVKEDFEMFRQNIEKVFNGAILKDVKITFNDETGNKKEVKGAFIPILGDNNNVTEIILALEEYEQKNDNNTGILNFYNLILNNAPVGIMTFDIKGNYTFVNEEFLKLLGYEFTYEEVLNWNLYKLTDRDKILPGFTKAIEGETVTYTRDYMPTPSEQKFSFYQLFAPLKDKDGSVIGVLGLLSEITDKSIIPQNMIENEEKYREIFHLLEDSIILLKETEKVADANKCTFVLLGEPIDSIVTKNFRDYFEKIGEKEEEFFSNLHSTNEAYLQTNLKRFDEETIPVTIYAKGLEISGLQYFVVIMRKEKDSIDDYRSTPVKLVNTSEKEEQNIIESKDEIVEEESVVENKDEIVEERGEDLSQEGEEELSQEKEEQTVQGGEEQISRDLDMNKKASKTSNKMFDDDDSIDLFKIPIVKIGKDAIIKKINSRFTSTFDYNEDDIKNKYLSDIITQDLDSIKNFLHDDDQNSLLEPREVFVRHKNETLLNYSIFYLSSDNGEYFVLFRKKDFSSSSLINTYSPVEYEHRMQLVQSLTGRISSVYSLYIYLIQGYVSILSEMKNVKDSDKSKIDNLVLLMSEIESYTNKLLIFSQSKTLSKKEFDLLPLMEKVMLEYAEKYSFLKIENNVSNAYVNGNFEIFEVMFYDLLEYLCGSIDSSGSILITVSIIEDEKDNLGIENYDKTLLICIKEQGYTISEEILPNIFEPFISSVNNKSNIGLSFVYGIVKSLGGTIQVNKDTDTDYSITIKIPVKID